MKRLHFLIGLMVSTTLLLAGCAPLAKETSFRHQIFAMDTIMTLTAYGDGAEEAVMAAIEEINRLDRLLSTNIEQSEIYQLNETKSATLSEESLTLLQASTDLYESTGGLFDIAIYPIVSAWGFTTQTYQVPSKETIASLLPHCDPTQIQIDGTQVTLPDEQMKIDFGGIAKGFTSDRVMDIFTEHGITSAIVTLGGNVQALHTKPDGSPWQVAVQYLDHTDDYAITLQLDHEAAITSGSYQRFFESDGKTYHHIIDPRTGYPADSGLASVTIVSEDGTLADGLSTSLFIMGLDEATDYWRSHSDQFDAVFITDDGSVLVTEGLEGRYTPDSDHPVTVIPLEP